MIDLEGIAYFASAEAASQGYDLTSEQERMSFFRHIEGSARQYFMAHKVDREYALVAPDPKAGIGETFTVRILKMKYGEPVEEAGAWNIPAP